MATETQGQREQRNGVTDFTSARRLITSVAKKDFKSGHHPTAMTTALETLVFWYSFSLELSLIGTTLQP
jgi:hypothetical protein